MSTELADTWGTNLGAVLDDLLRENPSLVITALEPDKRGHQRFLVHNNDQSEKRLKNSATKPVTE